MKDTPKTDEMERVIVEQLAAYHNISQAEAQEIWDKIKARVLPGLDAFAAALADRVIDEIFTPKAGADSLE